MGANFPWSGVGSAWPCLILSKKWPKRISETTSLVANSKGSRLLVQRGYRNILLNTFFGTPCLLALVVVLITALAPKALEDSPRVETSGEGLGGQADLDKHKHKPPECLSSLHSWHVRWPPHLDHQRDLQLCFPFFLSFYANMCPPWAMYCICCQALE